MGKKQATKMTSSPVAGFDALLAAVLDGLDVLEHRVDRLQDPAFDRLELTHPHRVHRAVVLQVVCALLGLKKLVALLLHTVEQKVGDSQCDDNSRQGYISSCS